MVTYSQKGKKEKLRANFSLKKDLSLGGPGLLCLSKGVSAQLLGGMGKRKSGKKGKKVDCKKKKMKARQVGCLYLKRPGKSGKA